MSPLQSRAAPCQLNGPAQPALVAERHTRPAIAQQLYVNSSASPTNALLLGSMCASKLLGGRFEALHATLTSPSNCPMLRCCALRFAQNSLATAPCEALLCLANLFIVLGLRDAVAAAHPAKEQQAADKGDAGADRGTKSSSSSKAVRASPSGTSSRSASSGSRCLHSSDCCAAAVKMQFGSVVHRRQIVPVAVLHPAVRIRVMSSSKGNGQSRMVYNGGVHSSPAALALW
ncbi:hypothetical protein COO60DRAFT_1542167 [Scenedesmus sp. NREL 46B-D3]|nr:hypothetical protein COO60DRAFT_1542167 [Scenedesmus sp. NREL 46B-D3]